MTPFILTSLPVIAYPEVEIIKADASEIDKAWRNVADGMVKFRYVIDMSTLK